MSFSVGTFRDTTASRWHDECVENIILELIQLTIYFSDYNEKQKSVITLDWISRWRSI
jgi:hypothetical protein